MAYDGLFTRKMIESLQFLTRGRIHKINQPENDTIIMVVRQNRKNHQLLLSIHPNFSRLQITDKKYDNPFNPPMFARVFRKHLEGGFIQAFVKSTMIVVLKLMSKARMKLVTLYTAQLF